MAQNLSPAVKIVPPPNVGEGMFEKARGQFDAKYTATGSFQTANVPVTITGVGFFDFQHGQTGVAPNGIELHAVLDVQFGTGSGDSVSVAGPGGQSATIGQAAGVHQHARRTPTTVSDAP